jgi:hypothetical protein
VRHGPSAALESAALVLFRPAGPLHHSVDGDLRGGRQFHRRGSFLVGLVGLVVVRLISKRATVFAGLDPIESTFASVRLRTRVTSGPGSRAVGVAMAFKLI